jgi:hypothetical protein|eukprot:COSAG06_NODE_4939_length_3846_cov_1.922338_4_plen_42_part_00
MAAAATAADAITDVATRYMALDGDMPLEWLHEMRMTSLGLC